MLNPNDQKRAEEFLKRMQRILATNDCTFMQSEKNRAFDDEFPLRDAEKRELLKKLTADDCVEISRNDNPRYPDSDVFVFIREMELHVYGETEKVLVYVKTYIREGRTYDLVVVISFHREGMHDIQ